MLDRVHAYLSEQLAQVGVDGTEVYWGNTVNEYLVAFFVFVGAYLVVHLIQWVILRWLGALARKTRTELDDTFIKIVESLRPPFYAFVAFWLALQTITISGLADTIVTSILIIWLVYQFVTAVGIFVEDVLFKHVGENHDPTMKSALRLLVTLAKGAFWGLGFILLLSNLGVDVGALIAGVGIGGIAIAFALQGILSDLFSSFSLYFDRPFKVGDFIIAGETLGTIKHIGFRSTRIASLSGEEIVVPNQDLAKVRIKNYKLMEERRIVFTFRILYETPLEKAREVPNIVRTAIESEEKVRFDRAHLHKFGDSSYDYEVVYYVLDPDYAVYMDIQQSINFKMIERFKEVGVAFAYPTRTLRFDSSDVLSVYSKEHQGR